MSTFTIPANLIPAVFTNKQVRDLKKNGTAVVTCHYTKAPHGMPGNFFYVAETWSVPGLFDGVPARKLDSRGRAMVRYSADGHYASGAIRKSCDMPQWASRFVVVLDSCSIQAIEGKPAKWIGHFKLVPRPDLNQGT